MTQKHAAAARPVIIRPGHLTDVPSCVDILLDWVSEISWADEQSPRAEILELWEGYFTHDLSWVAQDKGRILGFCSRGGDNINALYVAGAARGQGLGKRLLDAAKAERDWITVWAYDKNPRARAFYRREGLIEISREVEEGSGLIDVEHRWARAGDISDKALGL